MHGWQMVVYAAIVAALLALAAFGRNRSLAKRKRKMGPQLVVGRRVRHPEARWMDPHGGEASSMPGTERREKRGLRVVR